MISRKLSKTVISFLATKKITLPEITDEISFTPEFFSVCFHLSLGLE